MDVLTVVLHEMGHLLGRVDLDSMLAAEDLMSDRLPAGARRSPGGATHALRDAVFADLDDRAPDAKKSVGRSALIIHRCY